MVELLGLIALLIDNYICDRRKLGTFDRYDRADSWTLSIGPDNNRQSLDYFVKNNILVGGLDHLFQPIQKHSLLT